MLKIYRLIDRGIRLFMRSRSDLRIEPSVVFRGMPVIRNVAEAEIQVGANTVLCSRSSDTALGVTRPVVLRTLHAGAHLSIGADVGISGAAICAAGSVKIGDRVLIGSEVIITDSDFHPLASAGRRRAPVPIASDGDAVVIESDVFIGARAIVLKGVRIGRGSVVGAGSVVTRDVDEFTIVAGNPARVISKVPDS